MTARRSAGPAPAGEAGLRAAAFGDAPGADVPRLLTAGAPAGRRRWLAAVALGGQGRYAAATTLLRPLLGDPDPVLAALAGTALASHRRQLGAHATARRFDGAALGRLAGPPAGSSVRRPAAPDPDGMDAAGARLDALLGLAADAVGLGRTGEAQRLLDAAGRVPAGWRGTVRRLWVTAEVALAAGRPAAAVPPAASAARIAHESGALRHVTKSEAILATALHVTATESGRADARDRLAHVRQVSLEQGMLPLAWPSALLLADLTQENAQELRDSARDALRCILSRSDADSGDAARKSPWMPTTLLAAPER